MIKKIEVLEWLVKMLLLFVACITIACNKKFDEPPLFEEPDINTTMSIAELKSRHVKGAIEAINDDVVISGIVVADDKSGNYYKSLVIQDTSGGILLRIDQVNFYANYPVGRRVYVKCKGLYLGDYNGLMQIGGGVDESDPSSPTLDYIASNLIGEHLLKGSLNNIVTPAVVTVSQITSNYLNRYQNTLIQLDNFEFDKDDTAKTYADIVGRTARNFTIKNCTGDKIILRNSNFANFAGLSVPDGNGSIIAIFSVFSSTKQLNIRDTGDVKFNNERCPDISTGDAIFSEDFETVNTATGNTIALTGWQNVSETGSVKFTGTSFSGNKIAKISAFSSKQDAVKTWLVTPVINLQTAAALSFTSTDGYDNGATLKAYISTNYIGSATPWSDGTWTPLDATVSKGHTSGYGSFITSGNVDLSAYSGNVYFAFVYEGADPTSGSKHTTTFEIDNVRVKKI